MADPRIDELLPRATTGLGTDPMTHLREIGPFGAVFMAPPPPADPGGGAGNVQAVGQAGAFPFANVQNVGGFNLPPGGGQVTFQLSTSQALSDGWNEPVLADSTHTWESSSPQSGPSGPYDSILVDGPRPVELSMEQANQLIADHIGRQAGGLPVAFGLESEKLIHFGGAAFDDSWVHRIFRLCEGRKIVRRAISSDYFHSISCRDIKEVTRWVWGRDPITGLKVPVPETVQEKVKRNDNVREAMIRGGVEDALRWDPSTQSKLTTTSGQDPCANYPCFAGNCQTDLAPGQIAIRIIEEIDGSQRKEPLPAGSGWRIGTGLESFKRDCWAKYLYEIVIPCTCA